MFDVTATSNHWVLNPGRNLGLQLALESTKGAWVNSSAGCRWPLQKPQLAFHSICSAFEKASS